MGITSYISQAEGCFGVLKERYSDFLVNEIDLDEEVRALKHA